MTVADAIFGLFEKRGSEAYFGEDVSVTEHCLQTAHAALLEGAAPTLVIAALLHDVGHLVEAVPDDLAQWATDARHEDAGARWLAARFGPEIYEPVRLHVPAKRYLCAVEPSYFGCLSPASVRTLQLQGGPMSADEVAAFERQRCFADALRVRRWDDQGKVGGLATPPLAEYRASIEQLTRPGPGICRTRP